MELVAARAADVHPPSSAIAMIAAATRHCHL
jgi:hypothetical protein